MRFVGHYEILSDLGDGGMGSVKLGRAPDGRLVVLKQPHAGDASLRDLLLDEARVGLRLKHPHIVETIDFFELDGQPVLVVAYVSGASLMDLRAFGPLPLPVVARVGRQIAEALDSLHHAKDDDGQPLNILHRDVTPANIMLGHDGEARLIDLGIAKHDERKAQKTRTGYLRGTLRYMAPEIFDRGVYSPQSDLWALGVSLLDAALGRQAIRGMEGEVVARIVGGRVLDLDPDEKLDRRFEKAIKKLLQVNPKKRPKRGNEAAILFSMLEKELGGDADTAQAAVREAIGEEQPFSDEKSSEATELVVSRATAMYRGQETAFELPPTEPEAQSLPARAEPDDAKTIALPPRPPPRTSEAPASAVAAAEGEETLDLEEEARRAERQRQVTSTKPTAGGGGFEPALAAGEPTEAHDSIRLASQVASMGLDPMRFREELNAELKGYLELDSGPVQRTRRPADPSTRPKTPKEAIASYAKGLRDLERPGDRTPPPRRVEPAPPSDEGPERARRPPLSIPPLDRSPTGARREGGDLLEWARQNQIPAAALIGLVIGVVVIVFLIALAPSRREEGARAPGAQGASSTLTSTQCVPSTQTEAMSSSGASSRWMSMKEPSSPES